VSASLPGAGSFQEKRSRRAGSDTMLWPGFRDVAYSSEAKIQRHPRMFGVTRGSTRARVVYLSARVRLRSSAGARSAPPGGPRFAAGAPTARLPRATSGGAEPPRGFGGPGESEGRQRGAQRLSRGAARAAAAGRARQRGRSRWFGGLGRSEGGGA
jgi:hypothetical protein